MKKTILSLALLISGVLMQCMLVSNANSTPTLTSNWATGFDGMISADGQASTYPYQVGRFDDDTFRTDQLNIVVTKNGVEEHNSTMTLSFGPDVNFDTSSYPEFTGSDNRIRTPFGNLYGQWYIRRIYCHVRYCSYVRAQV